MSVAQSNSNSFCGSHPMCLVSQLLHLRLWRFRSGLIRKGFQRLRLIVLTDLHLPSSTIIYHHLPSSTIIYHHLPLIPVGQNKDGAGAVRPCFNQFDRRPWVELVKSPHPRGHCCKKPWGKTGRRCLLNQVQVIGLKLRKV